MEGPLVVDESLDVLSENLFASIASIAIITTKKKGQT